MTDAGVRWGVLGTANIGRAAVNPAIRASSNGSLRAIASRDGDTARAFARAHDIPTAYGSYEALLEDERIDAVYVPLPNSLHREWTIRAAEHGKHVLCEKPLALDAAECEEMAAAARAHGVKLMEAFMYRFHPRSEQVLRSVREGSIGEVKAVRSSFTFRLRSRENIRLDPGLGGGALMDVGCYCVNVSRTLAGREPERVSAVAEWGPSGVDEALAGMMDFGDGLVAHFDCALTMERCESYEVAGTDGYMTVASAFLPGSDDVEIVEVRGGEGTARHAVRGADEYRLMVEHFAACVLDDVEPRYPASEAAANMRTIEALYRSARAGGASEPVRSRPGEA